MGLESVSEDSGFACRTCFCAALFKFALSRGERDLLAKQRPKTNAVKAAFEGCNAERGPAASETLGFRPKGTCAQGKAVIRERRNASIGRC